MVLWTSDSVCVQGDVTAKVGAGGKARGISQRLRDILWPWDPGTANILFNAQLLVLYSHMIMHVTDLNI
jgi:hypothetical protein